MGVNLVVFSGNMGADPELKEFDGDKVVCKFPVANNRKWGKGEDKQETTWADVETWGQQARFLAEYTSKGREVTVIGRLRKDRWEDKDGNPRSAMKIVADSVELHSNKAAEQGAAPTVNIAEKLTSALALIEQGIPKEVAVKAVMAE